MFALLTGVVYGPGLTMDPGYIKYGPGFLDCKPVHRPVIASLIPTIPSHLNFACNT